ncbi:MAG TPA: HAMP domain-containing sensor histidine kinase [Usitatibacter sp.]|nr:HAMP domain-containing sensor histidine kinase [Usitatibacter sp.]
MSTREPGERSFVVAATAELALAAGLSLVAGGIRYALDPWLGTRQPYTPAFGAVAIAVWVGGWRAGLLTAVASQLLATHFFLRHPPLTPFSEAELVALASYYFTAFIVIYLGHRARRAARQLEVDARQKDLFLATLSHELRNPLAPIVSAGRILERTAGDDPRARRAIAMLERQAGHLTRLLDDLLDLSRVSGGRLELKSRPMDLRLCIRDAAETVRTAAQMKSQELRAESPPEAVMTLGDPTRITQIVGNLLDNAVKYCPAGSLIEATAEPAGKDVRVVVRDNGPGIDPNLLPDIFDAFSNAPTQTSRPANGLGIGLWLAHRLAGMHGGSLTVESERGRGTRFTLTLPGLEAAIRALEGDGSRAANRG